MARPKKIAFQISARDKQATASLRKLSARFKSLMRPLDKLNYKLRANKRALKPITDRLEKMSRSYKNIGKNVSVGITAPLALAGTAITKASTDFETGMIKVKALTGATSEGFIRMENLAKKLGSTTQFSATQAADGMSYLAMAGFNTEKIISAIPGVLDLASAAQLDLGEASDFASNILTGFGKEAIEMGNLSNKLTYAFTKSNTTLTELHNGLTKVGGIAVKAGVSFEDITASMMALADAGHKGETAGVALAGALSRVSKFSLDGLTSGKGNEVSKTLASLGINLDEFLYKDGPNKGKFKIKFQDFIKLLDDHKAALPDYQKIFGQDAGKYIVGLSGQFKKMNGYLKGINNESEGLSKHIADLYMSGTGGAFKLLLSAIEGLMIKMGDSGLLNAVNVLTRSFSYFISDLSTTSKSTFKFGMILAGVLAILGPGAYAIGMFMAAMKKLVVVLGIANLQVFLLGLKFLAITVAIGLVIYSFYLLYKNWDLIIEKMSNSWNQFTDDLTYFFGNLSWAFKKGFIEATNDVIDHITKLLEWIKGTSLGSWLSSKMGIDLTGNITHFNIPEQPIKLKNHEHDYVRTNNILEYFMPRLSPLKPLLYEGFEQKQEWKWLPDAISKGIAEVYGGKDPTMLLQPSGDDFDFYGFKSQIAETKISEKQELDVNINIAGANKETRVETRNRSRAKLIVDTGRIVI